MPCRDYQDDTANVDRTELTRLFDIEAAFCALATVLEKNNELNNVLTQVDWDEIGITKRQFLRLWNDHKAEDEARREREAAERAKLDKIEQAKAKLTDEEKRLLGIR